MRNTTWRTVFSAACMLIVTTGLVSVGGLAFSSDPSAAGPGVYLLSFTPGNDIRRVVQYASSQGRTSFAALLP